MEEKVATPAATPTPAGGRSIRNTRLRVTKAFKRLRTRKAPANAGKEQLANLGRLDEEGQETQSEVSGITDVGDDLSFYDDRPRQNSRSKSLPEKTSDATDLSFSQCVETWREWN